MSSGVKHVWVEMGLRWRTASSLFLIFFSFLKLSTQQALKKTADHLAVQREAVRGPGGCRGSRLSWDVRL